MIKGLLVIFCQIWGKTLTSEMEDGYYQPLKKYKDEDIKKAGYKCLDELTLFPKPADISKRIIVTQSNNGGSDFESKHGVKCSLCGHIGLGISEPRGDPWECRECYSGLSPEQHESKINEIISKIEKPF